MKERTIHLQRTAAAKYRAPEVSEPAGRQKIAPLLPQPRQHRKDGRPWIEN